MNIYSIKEIVEATNNILRSSRSKNEKESKSKKENKNHSKKININDLKNKYPKANNINYRIKIKPEIKDHMINELYLFIKKKIKKNTLKIIIEEQLEIKNLKNKLEFLYQSKKELINNYKILQKKYDLILENYKILTIDKEKLSKLNINLEIENKKLQDNLTQIMSQNKELALDNKKFEIDKNELQENLNINIKENENLSKKNLELNAKIKEIDSNFENISQKNRSFEINNAELKNTISRYVINTKKIQEKLNLAEKSKSFELNEINKKVKFYQDENVRLSGELLSIRRKNETIKVNLTDIEVEKEKISNKIKELSETIEQKTNVVSTNFAKENDRTINKDIEKLNDKEQKSLDEVISRIFNKI